MIRTEYCACGGSIKAGTMKESANAVQAHNATVGHQTWRGVEDWREVQMSPVHVTLPESLTAREIERILVALMREGERLRRSVG